jgi:hypothetical protein
VIVWQICLVAWTYTQVSNAARTASRVEGRGGDGEKAAKNALSKPLQKTIQKIDVKRREGGREGEDAAAHPGAAGLRPAARHRQGGAAA